MSEKLWYLKNCNLFEQVSEEELRHVELSSKAKTFPRNGPIYLPADGANYVLLLASGRAKICNLTAVGKQSILAFFEPGELFGELALVDSGVRDEYAEAVEQSTVVMIPAEVLQQLVERHSHGIPGCDKNLWAAAKTYRATFEKPALFVQSGATHASIAGTHGVVWHSNERWRPPSYLAVTSGLSECHRKHSRDRFLARCKLREY